MTFKTNDKDIMLEDTGNIRIYNYPATKGSSSYIRRIYRKIQKDVLFYEEVEGEPIYFHDLTGELLALAIILGNAQNVLSQKLPREDFLKPIKNNNG